MPQRKEYNIKIIYKDQIYRGIECPELLKIVNTGSFHIDFISISDSITSQDPSGTVKVDPAIEDYISKNYPLHLVKFYDKDHDVLTHDIQELSELNPEKIIIDENGQHLLPVDDFPIVVAPEEWQKLDDLLDNVEL